jgi:hypothetical protein
MQKNRSKHSLVAGAIIVFAMVIAIGIPNANAQDSDTGTSVQNRNKSSTVNLTQVNNSNSEETTDGTTNKVHKTTNTSNASETTNLTATEKAQAAHTKLTKAKLKLCQNREQAINNIMARQGDRGDKQLDVLTKIADRVKAFYKSKGLKVDNYDDLVAAVNTSRKAAIKAVKTVADNGMVFDCDADNPKAAIAAYKESIQSGSEALKAYKTAVKNLIVAVKSAQGSTQTGTNTSAGSGAGSETQNGGDQ